MKTNARRQAQSLLVFVNHALKALASKSATKDATEPLTSEILLLLLDLGSSNRDVNGTPDDISKVVRSSILNALGVMSAVEFIRGTLVILQSLDALVCSFTK